MKKCSECKVEKSLSEFYKIGNGSQGVRPRCKECTLKAERKKYGESFDVRHKKSQQQRSRMEDSELRSRHMLAQRRWHLKKTYGMSLDEFDSLLSSQDGGCAICGTKPVYGDQKTRMVVDHCHETDEVRGILCDLCNTAIGKFKDDPDLLRKAASYIDCFKAKCYKPSQT